MKPSQRDMRSKSAPTGSSEKGRLLVGGLFKPDRLAGEGRSRMKSAPTRIRSKLADEIRSHKYVAPTKNKA